MGMHIPKAWQKIKAAPIYNNYVSAYNRRLSINTGNPPLLQQNVAM
jgi:hypothetical protein